MNPHLTPEQHHHLLADIRNARDALDKLGSAIAGNDHPRLMREYVREVEMWMGFARIFCTQAIMFDDERREQRARTPAND